VPRDPRTKKILKAKVDDHYDMLLQEARSGDREGSGSGGEAPAPAVAWCLLTVMMIVASLAVVLKAALSVLRRRCG
jgi:hypothetical protein